MKGKAQEEDLDYDGRMREEEETRMSKMLQEHLIQYGHFPSAADSDPFWHHCQTVFTTRFSLRQLKKKIFSLYRQQQEILQSCAPEATQTVERQGNECGGATEQVRGPFSRFCRTHFPSRFSFRELKKKVLSFHQQLKWQALSATKEENESPAPSGSEDQAAQPRREKQGPPPEQDVITADMGNACSQNIPLRPVVEEQADTKTASEDANLQPYPGLLAEGSHLPTSNHQSDAEEKAMVAGNTLNLHDQPLTISEASSPRPWQAYAGGDTIQLDNRGDDEATNPLVLPKESNHLPATKCHSNTQVKAIAAVDFLNLDHQCLSIDNERTLQLRRFPTAIDTENKSGTEANFEGIHLQLDSLTTKDTHLPKHQSDAKERAIVAFENSKPHDPLWSIGNDSPLQPWQALTRVEATQIDNSDTRNLIDFPMERPATKTAKCDTLSKSNHRSCKQATLTEASDDNFQAVRASSGANNADAERHGQDAKSLHHVATFHGALSILQDAGNRCKKRFADAQGVQDARHQIKVLRQSAILDLAQARVTLSQIAQFHSN